MVSVYHSMFMYSLIYGHLSCFYFRAIVNKAAMNVLEHFSLWHVKICRSVGHMKMCIWGCKDFPSNFPQKIYFTLH